MAQRWLCPSFLYSLWGCSRAVAVYFSKAPLLFYHFLFSCFVFVILINAGIRSHFHLPVTLFFPFFLFESFLLRKGKNLNKTRASCLWNVILNPPEPFSSGNGGVVVSAPQLQTFRGEGKQLDAVDADDTSVMWMSRVSVIIQLTHTLTLRDTHFHESVISELWFIKQNRRIKETKSSDFILHTTEAKRLCAAFQSFVVFCLFVLFVGFLLLLWFFWMSCASTWMSLETLPCCDTLHFST